MFGVRITPSHVQMRLSVAVTLNHSERTVHSPHELYTKECTHTVDFCAPPPFLMAKHSVLDLWHT